MGIRGRMQKSTAEQGRWLHSRCISFASYKCANHTSQSVFVLSYFLARLNRICHGVRPIGSEQNDWRITLFPHVLWRSTTARCCSYCGQVALGSMLTIDWTCCVGIIGLM